MDGSQENLKRTMTSRHIMMDWYGRQYYIQNVEPSCSPLCIELDESHKKGYSLPFLKEAACAFEGQGDQLLLLKKSAHN